MQAAGGKVDNAVIADLFRQLADVLDVEGENRFRIRAYRNAARLVEDLPRPVSDMLAHGEDLDQLPGIGRDLAAKMAEIVRTRRLKLLEALRHGRGGGLARLLELPDLGPRRVKLLSDALGVKDLAGLRRAAKRGLVAGIPGFGEALQAKLLGHLQAARLKQGKRLPIGRAREIAAPLLRHLRRHRGILALEIAGSFRRQKQSVGDLDILVSARDGAALVSHFLAYPGMAERIAAGPTRAAMRLKGGFQVDLRVVPLESFGAALLYFTGSKEHNVALRRRARQLGYKVNEYGIYKAGRRLGGRSEGDVYRSLGLKWMPPPAREGSRLDIL